MNSIDKFNKLSKPEFISIFGNVFEKTEWIAEKCYDSKPYNSFHELVNKMMEIFDNSIKKKHLEILNSHPNLAVEKKVDIWLVVYQSSGIDVHTGVVGLAGGMTKSVVAMNEIKKAGIPTFAIAARAVAGGTYASNFFMHDFILIESNSVENMLFSGKRVTANILKGTDQIPEDFGTGPGVIKAGLADMTLENRKKLKETITKLANIILKKEESEISNEEEFENRQSNIKISSAS